MAVKGFFSFLLVFILVLGFSAFFAKSLALESKVEGFKELNSEAVLVEGVASQVQVLLEDAVTSEVLRSENVNGLNARLARVLCNMDFSPSLLSVEFSKHVRTSSSYKLQGEELPFSECERVLSESFFIERVASSKALSPDLLDRYREFFGERPVTRVVFTGGKSRDTIFAVRVKAGHYSKEAFLVPGFSLLVFPEVVP